MDDLLGRGADGTCRAEPDGDRAGLLGERAGAGESLLGSLGHGPVDDAPVLAALHPVNALAIFALAIVVARGATATVRNTVDAAAERS